MLSTAKLQTIVLASRIGVARAFYEDTLGLPVKGQSDGAVVFDVGGGDLRVSPVQRTAPSEHTVAGFAVDDVGAIVTTLRDRGVSFERFPGFPHDDAGIVATPDGSNVTWFRDPDGNLLSVVQYRVA